MPQNSITIYCKRVSKFAESYSFHLMTFSPMAWNPKISLNPSLEIEKRGSDPYIEDHEGGETVECKFRLYTQWTLHTYTNKNMQRLIPSGFFGPSRCLVPTPGLTSKYPMCSVCVCAYTHTCRHVHSHPRQKVAKTQITSISLLLSKTAPHVKRQVFSINHLTLPIESSSLNDNEQTVHTRAHAHLAAGVFEMSKTLRFSPNPFCS